MSRIGNKSIALPEKVKIAVGADGQVTVEGPKGKLEWTLPDTIRLEESESSVQLTRVDDSRKNKALHGLARSLVANMIQGVSSGFVKKLLIQGVGFRAALNGKDLQLSLGFSHPIIHPIPEGISVQVDDNTKITIEGIDKQLVGQVAADIRSYYPPEPYKGKGVRYDDEQVRRKAGKSVQ